MSNEEKKAIEYFQEHINYFQEQIKIIENFDCDYYEEEYELYKNRIKQFNTILNLIQLQQKKVEIKNKIIEFCNKDLTEQVRILLAKYWLTHTNDEVFETFGCDYVPNIEYQNKAREIKDILELELHKKINLNTLSKFEIKAIMGGATSYPIK